MWSSENAVNYLDFTGFLDFSIKNEFKDQDQLIELVNQFKSSVDSNDITSEEYHQFLSTYGSYLDIINLFNCQLKIFFIVSGEQNVR